MEHGIYATNNTAMVLTFKMLVAPREIALLGPIEPGMTRALILQSGDVVPESSLILGQDGCTLGDVVAYDPAGAEVARRPPPLCLDETWVIQESQASGAPSP